jgi:hypothetical protein
MNETIQILDGSGDRRYFTQLPNIVFDFPLNPYTFRVYAHIKRVAGESGICWQSTRTIAERCNISAPSVTRAIKELTHVGLIRVTKIPSHHGEYCQNQVSIVDIWQANMSYFNLAELGKKEQRNIWKEAKVKKD